MNEAIWRALTTCICVIAVMLTGFTLFDLGSGASSTALWVSMIGWPVVAIISGWILVKDPRARHMGEDDPLNPNAEAGKAAEATEASETVETAATK